MPIPINPVVQTARRLSSIQKDLVAKEMPSANLLNSTRTTVDSGDVVLLSTAQDRAVVLIGDVAASLIPLIVLIGGPPTEIIKCVLPGSGVVPVLCSGPAFGPGDTIIASSTPKHGKVLAGEVEFSIIGISIVTKAAGVTQASAVMLASVR